MKFKIDENLSVEVAQRLREAQNSKFHPKRSLGRGKLVRDSQLVEASDLENLPEDSEELIKILTSTVRITQKTNS